MIFFIFAAFVLGLLNRILNLYVHGAAQLLVLLPVSLSFVIVRLVRNWKHMLLLGDVECFPKNVPARTVDFVWITRHPDGDKWLLNLLGDVDLSHTHGIRFWRFVTRHEYLDDDTDIEIFLENSDPCASMSGTSVAMHNSCPVTMGNYLHHMVSYNGKPQWDDLFNMISERLPSRAKVGVFCCGPQPLCVDVREACTRWRIRSIQDALDMACSDSEHVDQIGMRILCRSECFS